MIIDRKKQTVIFEDQDHHFVKKFGLEEATDMVLDYASVSGLPFIYDVYQLASFLGFSVRELYYLTNNTSKQYQHIIIKKKDGHDRHIYAPNSRLKWAQKKIYREILSLHPISEYATAYHKGAALYSNAQPHSGKKYILKMDISDFFNSITFQTVYNCVFNTRYFPTNIGTILTELCCKDHSLPQGAVTSPAISNIVMKFFDDVMGKWSRRNNISYTRYSDDITFSSDCKLYIAYTKAKKMLESLGFEINGIKTHFISSANQQTVTGLVVNEFPQTSREYRRTLRQELYYLNKFGAENVILRNNLTEYISPDGQAATSRYINHLYAKIAYVLQIDPENAEFRKERERILNNVN